MKYKFFLILCTIFMCTGCSRMGSCERDNLNLENVLEEISDKINQGEWNIGLLQDDWLREEEVRDLYNLSLDDVEEVMVKQAIIPASCGEIAIFHLKDEDMSKVTPAIDARMEQMKEEFSALPLQIAVVEQYQIAQNNNYVMFVIGEDAQKVIEYFNSL